MKTHEIQYDMFNDSLTIDGQKFMIDGWVSEQTQNMVISLKVNGTVTFSCVMGADGRKFSAYVNEAVNEYLSILDRMGVSVSHQVAPMTLDKG